MNIKFRFFRDLSPGQRLAVFKVFGVLVDGFDGKLTHSEEAQLLAEMLVGIRGTPLVTTVSARCEECAGTGKIGPDDDPGEMDCEVCNGTALDVDQQTSAQFSSLK